MSDFRTIWKRYGWKGAVKDALQRGMLWVRRWPPVYAVRAWSKNRRALARLPQPLKLHLGCGSQRIEGYINMDVEDWAGACDMIGSATRLPMFEDETVDHIFHHAMLEHLPPWETMPALREWRRVLKPGGTIQIETPDLQRIFEDWLKKGILSEEEAINNIFGGNKSADKAYAAQDHLTGFTFDRLSRMLRDAGFDRCERLEHDTYHHILVVAATKPRFENI